MGYAVTEKRTENKIIIEGYGKKNVFYPFGGKDESSQDLVQGLTAAGALFDEVALMPESFVNQATGRCSEPGAKLWFNCNPDGPSHWFKTGWLDRSVEKKLLHLHFTMDDNPSLSAERREYFSSLWSPGSVFYKRYILGLWVQAEGAIYDMFSDECLVEDNFLLPGHFAKASRYIAIDYGTQNATVFLDIVDTGKEVYVVDEWYHSGRSSGVQKTDSQYADALKEFAGNKPIQRIIMDPSAASFRAELRQRGWRIKDADNEVIDGIRLVGSLFSTGLLKIHKRCKNLVRELQSYVWDTSPTEKGNEKPVKKDDHGPDALRYFCQTIVKPRRLHT